MVCEDLKEMKNVGETNRNGQRIMFKTNRKGTSGRAYVWAMLDLLLTSKTIADARDATQKRAELI